MLSLRAFVMGLGMLHFTQLLALGAASRTLGWPEDMARLRPINRKLFKVLMSFIVFTVLGLGGLVVAAARQILLGGPLALGLCSFLFVFWLARSVTQLVIYRDAWPRDRLIGRMSFHALAGLFLALSGGYGALVIYLVLR